MPPEKAPEPVGPSLFHVIGHEILNPNRGIAVEKLDKRLAPKLRLVRSFTLDSQQQSALDSAFSSYKPPEAGTIDANLDLIESAAFLSADKEYINYLREKKLDDLTQSDYELVAKIVGNAPKLLPIDRLRSSIGAEEMEGMMEYFQGDSGAMKEFAQHLAEMGGSESFTNILVTDPGEKHGYKGWKILRDGYPHIFLPDYRGMPEGFNLLNPKPEHVRLARIVRACQFHVSNICRRGIPNRSRFEYSVRAFGAEGGDAPELYNLLPDSIHALDEYRKEMLGSTEKEVDRVPPPTENGIQSVLSAFHKPIKVVEDIGPLLNEDGSVKTDGMGKELRNHRESGFILGAGELFALLEGDNKLEIKRDAEGYTFFHIGNGPEMTMRGMTPEQRKAILTNPDVRISFANEAEILFGRQKFGENVATNPNINQERDGLDGLATLMLEQLKKNGVQLERVERFGEVAMDGQELTKDHPLVKDYAAQFPNDPEAAARKMMIELLVSFVQMKNSALALGEVTQLSWMWDLARKRNLFSPEIADKGLKRHIYDEAYDNNPNYFRVLAQPMGNIWPSWKKGNCDWFTVAEEGNPLDSYVPSLNPIDLTRREIVIPPIMVTVGDKIIPLHKLDSNDDLALRIKSIHGVTRWERSQWRTQAYFNMQVPNNIIANIVKESTKPNPNYDHWINWAGEYHNTHINEYNTMGIQEIPADQASKLLRTNFLNQENREALAHINYRPQIELLKGKIEGLPEEEFIGFFGWQRLNEADTRQNMLVGQMDHIFKYLKVYPQHWKANADGLARLVPTMNNAVDKRLEALMGVKPDIMKYKADEFFEGLTKQWMETAFVMAGMRDPKESLGFADEYVEQYLKEVHSTMGYTGERRYENIEDIILYCFQLRDKAAEIAFIKIKGSGKGVELDDTPLLELDTEKVSVEALSKIQQALTVGDWNVVFPFMSDPRDYIGNLIKDGKLTSEDAITGNESKKELCAKLQKAVNARKQTGNKLVKPYVRFGMQIQQEMEMETKDGVELVKVGKREVLGNYGLKSNPEKLHYLRILNQIEDKLVIPQDIVDSILVRMGASKSEYQEAINMQADAIEERLRDLEQRMIERAQELEALQAVNREEVVSEEVSNAD